jgi:hypothetical protein
MATKPNLESYPPEE